MLPPRASRPAADEDVHAAWGGSAKSLGLVRTDSESTATVARADAGKSTAEWNDGSDTVDRKSKPPLAAVAREDADDDGEDGDGPATVLKGQSKIVLPREEPPPPQASSDDDDLNETARANPDQENLETPVGLKKKDPPATSEPESGQTRVAPIVLPPTATATASATPVKASMIMPMPMPMHAWTPPSVPPPALTPATILAKALAIPPHKLALVVSLTLMVAALTFVFVRTHQTPAPAAAPEAEQAVFPPPVEVPPAAATTALPPPTLVLPPPAPTWASAPAPSQAQPHTTLAKAPPPPVHRSIPRATSRTSIPTHREQ